MENGIVSHLRANIGDMIFAIIVKSDYTRKKINLITVFILSSLFKNTIDTFIYFLLTSKYESINFIVSILITISLVYLWPHIDSHILKYESDLQKITDSIYDNFSIELYKYWRKRVVLVISATLIIYLSLVEMTSFILILAILRFLCTHFIIEKIDHFIEGVGWPGQFKNWLKQRYYRPSTYKFHSPNITTSYYPLSQSVKIPSSKSNNFLFNSMKIHSSSNTVQLNNKDIKIIPDYQGQTEK
jgi:hypothetical protein